MWSATSLPTAACLTVHQRRDAVEQLGDLAGVFEARLVFVGDDDRVPIGQRCPVGLVGLAGAHRRADGDPADGLDRQHVLLPFGDVDGVGVADAVGVEQGAALGVSVLVEPFACCAVNLAAVRVGVGGAVAGVEQVGHPLV